MGSALSSTELTVQGEFEMPGVPLEIAIETFRDMEAAPSFVPHIVSVEFLRGQPSEVGACWMEVRKFQGADLLIRKHITKKSTDPYYSISMFAEIVKSNSFCATPNFETSVTFAIHPSENGERGSIARWNEAFLSKGMYANILSALCLPCLKKAFIAQVDDEMQYYYEEALRRTIHKALGSNSDDQTQEVEQSSSRR